MDAWENGGGGADSYSSSTTGGATTAEIFEEQAAAGEEETTEKVFVAVPEQHKSGKSLLAWTLRHVGAVAGASVVVAHVHAPAQMIPMSTCAPPLRRCLAARARNASRSRSIGWARTLTVGSGSCGSLIEKNVVPVPDSLWHALR